MKQNKTSCSCESFSNYLIGLFFLEMNFFELIKIKINFSKKKINKQKFLISQLYDYKN